MAEPCFPGNETDANARVFTVAEIIRDFWPHRMSSAAAGAIDNYYLRLNANSTYQPRHRDEPPAPGTLEYAQEQAYKNGEL